MNNKVSKLLRKFCMKMEGNLSRLKASKKQFIKRSHKDRGEIMSAIKESLKK